MITISKHISSFGFGIPFSPLSISTWGYLYGFTSDIVSKSILDGETQWQEILGKSAWQEIAGESFWQELLGKVEV